MEKHKNVPQLRFPEFEGEWEKKRLGELSIINPITRKLPDRFIYIDLECVTDGELTQEVIVFKDEAPSRAQRVLEKDDILFQMVRPYQKNNLYFNKNGDYVASTGYAQIKTKQSPSFIYQYIHLQKFVDEVIERCTGTSYPAINAKDLAKICICYPALAEQQKIASFLTATDKKISQLKQKKTLLEQYQKGAMQKIFSQRIRFRDENGKEFPKWEKKRLGEVSERNQNKNRTNTETKVLTNSAINGIVLQSDYFDKDIANQNNLLNYYIVEVDDFVYNPRISVHAPVGPIKRNRIGIGVISPLYSVFRITEGVLEFFELYFSTNYWHEYMKGIANYGARSDRMNITTKDLYNMPIPFPALPEQTKIANFLSAINDKINHTQKQIEKAEVWKKGLMQQMFV